MRASGKNLRLSTKLPITYAFDQDRQRVLKEMCTTHLPLQSSKRQNRYASSSNIKELATKTDDYRTQHLISRGTATSSGRETASMSKMFPPVKT